MKNCGSYMIIFCYSTAAAPLLKCLNGCHLLFLLSQLSAWLSRSHIRLLDLSIDSWFLQSSTTPHHRGLGTCLTSQCRCWYYLYNVSSLRYFHQYSALHFDLAELKHIVLQTTFSFFSFWFIYDTFSSLHVNSVDSV